MGEWMTEVAALARCWKGVARPLKDGQIAGLVPLKSPCSQVGVDS